MTYLNLSLGIFFVVIAAGGTEHNAPITIKGSNVKSKPVGVVNNVVSGFKLVISNEYVSAYFKVISNVDKSRERLSLRLKLNGDFVDVVK